MASLSCIADDEPEMKLKCCGNLGCIPCICDTHTHGSKSTTRRCSHTRCLSTCALPCLRRQTNIGKSWRRVRMAAATTSNYRLQQRNTIEHKTRFFARLPLRCKMSPHTLHSTAPHSRSRSGVACNGTCSSSARSSSVMRGSSLCSVRRRRSSCKARRVALRKNGTHE